MLTTKIQFLMGKWSLRAVLVFIIGCFGLDLTGQDITNVRAFQENNKAVIVYDLLSTDPKKEFYVKLFASTDGGKTYGNMLSEVTGDANGIVKAGNGKMAVWDVLKESNSAKADFVFRLDASSVGADGVLPSYEGNGVNIQFIDIARSGNDVVLKALMSNKTQLNSQFIFANFLVVDDTDRISREFGGDINRILTVEQGQKRVISFVVKNVNPAAKHFSQFDFAGSGLFVKLKNVPISSGTH